MEDVITQREVLDLARRLRIDASGESGRISSTDAYRLAYIAETLILRQDTLKSIILDALAMWMNEDERQDDSGKRGRNAQARVILRARLLKEIPE